MDAAMLAEEARRRGISMYPSDEEEESFGKSQIIINNKKRFYIPRYFHKVDSRR
jgi:hypothetical protein